MSAAQLRHLLHHLAIKHFTVGVFVALDTVAAPSAPLFEEEGGSGMTGTWYVSYLKNKRALLIWGTLFCLMSVF